MAENKANKKAENEIFDKLQSEKYDDAELELLTQILINNTGRCSEVNEDMLLTALDEGVTEENISDLCRMIFQNIQRYYFFLDNVSALKRILKIEKKSRFDQKHVIEYEVNKDEFQIEKFEYYTKITTPQLRSGGKIKANLIARRFYFEHSINGLLMQNRSAVTYYDRASLVVNTTGSCDNDNLDLKHIINSLKFFFYDSDEGNRLDLHLVSNGKLTDKTEIFIMDKSDFPRFVIGNQHIFLF